MKILLTLAALAAVGVLAAPAGAVERTAGALPAGNLIQNPGAEGVAGPPAASEADAGSAGEWTATAADAEGDLELDEELLRRVREA